MIMLQQPDGTVLHGGDELLSTLDVPPRVKWSIPIKIAETDTSIGQKTDGIFVSRQVKTGDLIFKIPNPLLAVLGDGKEVVSACCDNGFARVNQMIDGHKFCTVPDPKLKLDACSACLAVFYCSKKCQKAAWAHHHKLECKTLAAMKQNTALIRLKPPRTTSFHCSAPLYCPSLAFSQGWSDITRRMG